jgi:hypothetical protein
MKIVEARMFKMGNLKRLKYATLSILLIPLIFVSGFAQDVVPSPSTPSMATPPVGIDEESESRSFQFFPAAGQWGDYFDLSVAAGSTITETVLLANTGSVTNDLRTYAIDAFTAAGGGFAAAEYGTPPNAVTSWLDFPDQVFSLETGSGVEIAFNISVPQGTDPGQYITAIAAANSESREVSGTENISQITRYVIPIFITVPGEVAATFEIGDISLSSEKDAVLIYVEILNRGDLRVRPKGTVELLDAEESLIASFNVEMESVYARDRTVLTLGARQNIPPGLYSVRVILEDPDTSVKQSVTMTDLQFQGSGDLAVIAPISIASAMISAGPDVDSVQFATIDAIVSNSGDPVSNAQLSLVASLNGEEVERYPISQSLSLPAGDTPINTRYIPATGWTSGEWTFELLLETVEPNGAAVVVARQQIEGSITIP